MGCERDVLLTILSKELSIASPRLLSAFSRDGIPGYVYIEGDDLDNIRKALEGVGWVVRNKHGLPRANLVPFFDRVPLLEMTFSGISTTIQAPSWARVTCRGSYHNDLAFIKQIDPESAEISVLLIPRINMERERKGKRKLGGRNRPPQVLFDPLGMRDIYRTGQGVQNNQVHIVGGNIYIHGLLEKTFPPTDISDRSVNVTRRERDLFTSSGHPTVISFVNRVESTPLDLGDRIRVLNGKYAGTLGRVTDIVDGNNVVFTSDAGVGGLVVGIRDVQVLVQSAAWIPEFEIDDRIQVTRGEFVGTSGYVTAIPDNFTVVFESEAGVSGLQVARQDVRRQFKLGDSVRVSHGEHEDTEGFITDLQDDFATIYVQQRQKGQEVEPPLLLAKQR